MATDRTLLERALPPVPASAFLAGRAVAEALREVALDRDAVVVMVSEAVANSAAYAYPEPAAGGGVGGHAQLDGQALEVFVSDDGVGIAAHAESAGFGIGVPLMGDVADRVELAAGDGTGGTRGFGL